MADSDNQTDAPGLQPLANLGRDSGGALLDAVDHEFATEWSMGDAAATAGGEWVPTFHHKPFAAGVDRIGIPDAVTGTFNAMGSIGNLRGAFGANKMME